jgi:DNA mismatch repair protein MutL
MSHIAALPEELVGKISAGEVIERPASVVKELLENSLDAGALHIAVEIKQGGKQLIKVKDDGAGMDKADLKLCVDRHTTSKIKTLEDIYNIGTLGFRGEALSSIAAVSKLEIVSRYKNTKDAYRLTVAGNNRGIVASELAGGTMITINELFYNVPARLKFLKSNETETVHINDIIFKLALHNYTKSFDFKADGRKILFVEGVKTLNERLYQLFGAKAAKSLIAVNQKLSGITIYGYISTPQELKSSRNYIYTFVNGRLVNDKTVNHAIAAGYGNLLPYGKYPLAVVFIDIERRLIDVNVHPTKREIKFSNGTIVHNAVESAIKNTLINEKPVPVINVPNETIYMSSNGIYNNAMQAEKEDGYKAVFENRASFVQEILLNEKKYRLKPLYQAKNMYIIAADNDAVYIIDQHVAHEKLLYEKLKKQKTITGSQQLLTAVSISLKYRQAKILHDNMLYFSKFGFDIEMLGKDTFMINGVPDFLAEKDCEKVLTEALEQLEEELANTCSISDKEDLITKTVACHSAVRAGDPLNYNLMLVLINDFIECELPYCPHGRPGIIKLTFDELDKKFKRS